MSHFTVLVVGEDIEGQLARYNEELVVPRYIEATREQLVAKGRQEIAEYRDGRYAEYLADPKAYIAGCTNPGHVKYISEDFPKKLKWTDDEVYAEAIRWEEPEDIGPDGEVYSTRNPDAKWDWWTVGGRWSDGLHIKPDDELFGTTTTGHITTAGKLSGDTHPTYALVVGGEWFSKGTMGWFGMSHDKGSDAAWWAEWWRRVSELDANAVVTLVDCHI